MTEDDRGWLSWISWLLIHDWALRIALRRLAASWRALAAVIPFRHSSWRLSGTFSILTFFLQPFGSAVICYSWCVLPLHNRESKIAYFLKLIWRPKSLRWGQLAGKINSQKWNSKNNILQEIFLKFDFWNLTSEIWLPKNGLPKIWLPKFDFRNLTSEIWLPKNGLPKIDFRKWTSEKWTSENGLPKNGLPKMDFRKRTSENGLPKMDFRKWTSENGLPKFFHRSY
jgi:hypothetical protein